MRREGEAYGAGSADCRSMVVPDRCQIRVALAIDLHSTQNAHRVSALPATKLEVDNVLDPEHMLRANERAVVAGRIYKVGRRIERTSAARHPPQVRRMQQARQTEGRHWYLREGTAS